MLGPASCHLPSSRKSGLLQTSHLDVQVIAGPVHSAWVREKQREMMQQLGFDPDTHASSSIMLPPCTTCVPPVMGQTHDAVWVAQPRANMWSNRPNGWRVVNTSWALGPAVISSPVRRISSRMSWVLLLSWAHPINIFCTMTKTKYRRAAQWVVSNKGQLMKEEILCGCWEKAGTSGRSQWWGGELERGGKRRSNAIVCSEYRLPHGTKSFELLPAPGKPLPAPNHTSCTSSLNKLQFLIKLLIRHLI